MYKRSLIFIKIWEEQRVLYMKTYVHFDDISLISS